MEFLKELFSEGALTYEQLSAKVTERGFKLADLSTGNYVAKKKFEDEIANRDGQIKDLSNQISTRDADMAALKTQLETDGNDNKTKVANLTEQLSKLQTDYNQAKTDYEAKLTRQSYEFSVREFVNGQTFSSNAAKRDFTKEMLSADLKMKDKSIIGATDFLNAYKESNPDAFVVSKPDPEPPAPEPGNGGKPIFIQPTPPAPGEENPFNFNFSGVRGH